MRNRYADVADETGAKVVSECGRGPQEVFMDSSDNVYAACWGASGVAAALAADTRIGRRMAQISAALDRATAAGYSRTADDNLLADCLNLALARGYKT